MPASYQKAEIYRRADSGARLKANPNIYLRPEKENNKQKKNRKKLQVSFNKEKLTLSFVFLLLFLMAVLTVAQYCAAITTNFQINQTQNSIDDLMEEQRVLELEVARLASLDRIEEIARTQLGMKEVQQTRILTSAVETD